METMKKVLFLLLIGALSAGAQTTFYATQGIVNGPGLPASTDIPHNHPASPLLFETFDASGYDLAGWTAVPGGGGSIDPDYTTDVLSGTQSLFIDGGTDDSSFVTNSFPAQSEVFKYHSFKITDAPDDEDSYISMFRLLDADGATVLKVQVESSLFPRLTVGGQAASVLTPLTVGVTYYIWIAWNKDNGANSTASMAISTTKVQPTSGDFFAAITTGTQIANDASQIMLGYRNDGEDTSGPEMSIIYDYVMVDDIAIPNYP